MIWMVVVATKFVSSSRQFTTAPFRPPAIVTELIVTLDIRGRTFRLESLEKVIVELPINSGIGMPLAPIDETGAAVWLTFPGKTVNSHW